MSELFATPPVIRLPRVQSAPALSMRLPALLERVATGEQSALAELYELTVAKLFSLASLVVCNTQDAEEVVCDTFVQVWHSARQYDPQRGSALGWLLTICRSRALDRRRRNRSGVHAAAYCEEQWGVGSDDLLQIFEQDSAVFRAVAGLSPIRRRLIALAFFQGLTHEEIASETQLPVGTVKSHIRRALAMMRSELGDRGNGAQPE